MVSLTHLGMIGVIFLILLGLVSNSSDASIANIEDQMFLMNCPLPIFSALPTIVNITGFSVNYNLNYSDTYVNYVTAFECQIVGGNFNANTVVYESTEGFFALFDNAFAWIGYAYFTLLGLFQQLQALFTLISYFVTPTGFNIAGFTIDDLSGQALLIVVSIYGFCYMTIGIMLYKVLSPFGGGN